jgi:hypothetical protein
VKNSKNLMSMISRMRSIKMLCKREEMKTFEEFDKRHKLVGVLIALLFVTLTTLSVYGLFLDSFSFEMRRSTYFFEGADKVIFCASAFLFNAPIATLLCGGLLVHAGAFPKRAPGTLNDKLFTIPLGLGFTGIVYSLVTNGL